MYLVIDAHEDLAFNMSVFGREYTLSVGETRQKENGQLASQINGDTMLGWDEYQAGNVAIIFGTLFAGPKRLSKLDFDTKSYVNARQANTIYHHQLDLYHRLNDEHHDKFQLIGSKKDLGEIISLWDSQNHPEGFHPPIGIVPLMEGADAILDPHDLAEWWDDGVRIIGPAWVATRYCGGTREPGPLTADGKILLASMAEMGFVLDISHMDELAAQQALDIYEGQVIMSHGNAAELIRNYSGNRHFADDLLRKFFARDGIIGVIPYNNFLDSDWKNNGGRAAISLTMVADQIDHMCQLSGDALHTGIGTDFDGGFGLQSTPHELDSIADLQLLSGLLSSQGYASEEIAAILGRNWQRMLEYNLP